MKNCKCVLAAVMLIHPATFAQTTQIVPAASIEDAVIGWINVYSFTGVRKPQRVDDKLYCAAQLSIADSLATWIQASYVPKGEHFRRWLTALDDFRNWLTWACGPRNAMKIGARTE